VTDDNHLGCTIYLIIVFIVIVLALALDGTREAQLAYVEVAALRLQVVALETQLSHSACISPGPDYRIVPCLHVGGVK
jgi:hypothetical protein